MTATESSPETAPSPPSHGKARKAWRPVVATARVLGRVLQWVSQHKALTGVVLVLAFLGYEVIRRPTHIDVAILPKEMTEKGYTPEAASRLLRDAMVRMVSRANVPPAIVSLKTELAKVTVPQTSITVQSLVDIIGEFIPYGERKIISGDIIGDDAGMKLILRINNQHVGTIESFKPDKPAAWNEAAKMILHHTAPHILAWALWDEDPSRAVDLADRLVARMPKDHESAGWARMLRGNRHMALGEFDSAHAEFTAAGQATGRNATMRALLHSDIGRLRRVEAKYDDAQHEFEKAIGQDPTEPGVYHSYALSERRRALSTAYGNKVADPKPHLARSTALFERGKEAYQRYIATHPGDATARVNFALLLFDMGEALQATIGELEKASELDPGSPLPLRKLCEIQVKILWATEMPHACDEALRVAPNDPAVHAALAWYHYYNDNLHSARSANLKAIELDPRSTEHYAFRPHLFADDHPSDAEALGKLAARVNRHKSAILHDDAIAKLTKLAVEGKLSDDQRIAIARQAEEGLEESRRLNPAEASTYHAIAAARKALKGRLDPSEEESLYRYAVAAEPSDAFPALLLADFFHKAGRLDEARTVYDETIRKFPSHPGPHDEYINFLKKNADARQEFQVAMVLELRRWGATGSAVVATDMVNTAFQLSKIGNNIDALLMFERALFKADTDPMSAAGLYYMGNFLYKIGRTEWAADHYAEAIRSDESNAKKPQNDLLLVVKEDRENPPPDGFQFEWLVQADPATLGKAACTVIGERKKEADKNKLRQRLVAIDPRLKNQIDCKR